MALEEDGSFVGQVYFERAEIGTSPPVWKRVCNIFSIGPVGETNEQVESTTFCSGGYKQYISGLSDGAEITLEGNYLRGSAAGSTAELVKAMIADVKAKRKGLYRIVIGDTSPIDTLEFVASAISWAINPAVDDRNTVSFTIKVSGEITLGFA